MDLPLRAAVYVLLGVVLLLLLLPIVTTKFRELPGTFSDSECRASVIARAKTHIGIFDIDSPLPFSCSTKTIYLKYDPSGRKKDENLQSATPTYYIRKGDADKVKWIFAEALAKCLWQMADGTVDPFGSGEGRCVICYDLIIEKDIVDPNKGDIAVLDNFQSYLELNKFSKTKDFYSKYFNTAEMPSPKLEQNGSPISQTIFFSYRKLSRKEAAEFAAKTSATGGTIGGCLAGAIFGFLATGPIGAVGGCLAGVVTAAPVIAAGTTAGAIAGYVEGEDGVYMLGFAPVYEMGDKCKGLF